MSTDDTLHRHSLKAAVWQLVIAVVVGVATGAVPAYLWMEKNIERQVQERLEPYEHLLFASTLADSDFHEAAVNEFSDGWNAMYKNIARTNTQPRFAAYVNRYLRSLANTENPSKHRANFERCRDVFARHVLTESSEAFYSEGWFLLRTGELDEAFKAANNALKQLKAEHARNPSEGSGYAGNIEFLMVHCFLAKGETEKAHKWAIAAQKHNPSGDYRYDPDYNFGREFAFLYQSTYQQSLTAMIKLFESEDEERELKESAKP